MPQLCLLKNIAEIGRLKLNYKRLLILMMTIFKLLVLVSVVANILLIYSSVVAFFLIKEDKKSIKQFYFDDED